LCEVTNSHDADQGVQAITTPAHVLAHAQQAPGSTAQAALDMFCGFLGSVAGDLALTLGARGGIYIGGGIVPRLGARFAASPFRARFEAKGRFAPYLQAIPTWVIDSPVSPALQGASQALSLTQWQ
jgi:glucokinase